MKLDGNQIQLDILDTSGDDGYADLHEKWFQYGQGFILVCNVTSKMSLKELEVFHQELLTCLEPSVPPRILVATAIDLPNRVVSKEEVKNLASQFRCPYWEVSAKTGEGIEASIIGILREVESNKLSKLLVSTIMRKSKKKEKEFISPEIPKYLLTKQQVFMRAQLTSNGTLICFYKDAGTLLIYKFNSGSSTPKRLENTSPITACRLKFPILVTFHENGILQAFNLQTEALNQYESQGIALKEVQTLILEGPFIYLISLKKIYVFQVVNLRLPPLEVPLVESSSNGPPLTGLVEDFCYVSGNHMILASKSIVQIWELNLLEKGGKKSTKIRLSSL